MASNSSIILTNLDFDTLKNTFKSYLRTQNRFNDYDFDGANISVLLDLLAYNTYLQSFYLNMVGNEMFLDTAQMKDSVVSHAKELNYTPRSFKSATATVNIDITSNNPLLRSVTIPKGTTFSARVGSNSFTFSTDQNIVTSTATTIGSNTTFTASNVQLFEGDYITDSYTVNTQIPNIYKISNKTVDTSSINVTVIEDLGATTYQYLRATSLFGLTADSKIFFIQGSGGESFEIVFGDGVLGRPPKNNSVVLIEYRSSSGELPNGAFQFKADGTIDGIANIVVSTVSKATSGAVSESIDSIKYNAPRHFTTQERAVTAEDYQTLLKQYFPEINEVTAYGGEEVNPPQYGKVFVSVDLNNVDGLPDVKRTEYYKFLKPRSPVSIDPMFVDPDYMYVYVESTINYNINLTSINPDDIRTLVISSILNYSTTYLNGFNKTLRYSKLINAIDNAHNSIVSNETVVKALRYITPTVGKPQSITIDFKMPLQAKLITDININAAGDIHTLESSSFQYSGQTCYLEDDGGGNMRVVTTGSHSVLAVVGSINYDLGLIQLSNFNVDSYSGKAIKIFATTKSSDIHSTKNTILNINESDIFVTVQQLRE